MGNFSSTTSWISRVLTVSKSLGHLSTWTLNRFTCYTRFFYILPGSFNSFYLSFFSLCTPSQCHRRFIYLRLQQQHNSTLFPMKKSRSCIVSRCAALDVSAEVFLGLSSGGFHMLGLQHTVLSMGDPLSIITLESVIVLWLFSQNTIQMVKIPGFLKEPHGK